LLDEELKYEFFENLDRVRTLRCGCFAWKGKHSKKHTDCHVNRSELDLTRRHKTNYLSSLCDGFMSFRWPLRNADMTGGLFLSNTSPIRKEIKFDELNAMNKRLYLILKYRGKPKRTRKDYQNELKMIRRMRL
jgi:hypothetical protein